MFMPRKSKGFLKGGSMGGTVYLALSHGSLVEQGKDVQQNKLRATSFLRIPCDQILFTDKIAYGYRKAYTL
jgi:hypothetical protein